MFVAPCAKKRPNVRTQAARVYIERRSEVSPVSLTRLLDMNIDKKKEKQQMIAQLLFFFTYIGYEINSPSLGTLVDGNIVIFGSSA